MLYIQHPQHEIITDHIDHCCKHDPCHCPDADGNPDEIVRDEVVG